jgi:beta-phosphoglucomutase
MHELGAVIFDMDGVLIDSEPIAERMIIELVAEEGVSITPAEIESSKGMIAVEFWTHMIDVYGLSQSVDYYRAKMRAEMNLYSPDLAAPGLMDLLEALRAAGVKMAVGTSGSTPRMYLVLKVLGIADFFEATVSGSDVTKSKPDPMVFLRAAASLGIANEQCMVVEDAFRGIQAAKTAGMTAVGFTGLGATPESLSEADSILNTFEGIDVPFLRKIHSAAQGARPLRPSR